MRKQNPIIGVVFWTFVSFLMLFPIYWLFVISVKPAVQLFSTPDVILSDPYRGNYAKVWGDRMLRGYMLNSMVISTGNAVLSTVLGFFACYALSRFNMSGKEAIFFWTITNRMAPPAVFLLLTQVYTVGDWRLSEHHETSRASTHLEEDDAPAAASAKQGFLPIETNWFDRLFIAVVIWVALSLFWFRFVEPLGLSIWNSNAIALCLAAVIIRKG